MTSTVTGPEEPLAGGAGENFVSDPEVAAAVADLKARWPAIGEAADHPLTEFFYNGARREQQLFTHRDGKRRLIFPFRRKELLSWVWLAGIFLGFHLGHMVEVIALLLIYNAWERRQKRRGKDQDRIGAIELRAGPYSLLRGDDAQREEWWLIPLSCREFVGICVGFHYARARAARGWRNYFSGRRILREIPGVLLLLFVIRSILGATAGQTAAAFAAFLGIMAAIPRSRQYQLRTAMETTHAKLLQACGHDREAWIGLHGTTNMLCMGILIGMLIWSKSNSISTTSILIATLACFSILQVPRVMARGTDQCSMFRRLVADLEKKYEARRAPWRMH